MTDASPLEGAIRVCIFLEGGVAYMPGLARSRPIELPSCDDLTREQLGRIVTQAMQHALDDAGSGDRRYFRIEITYGDAAAMPERSIKVPEESAPESLRELWQRQKP